MAVNIPGVISLVVFYLIILGIGLWAAWRKKQKRNVGEHESERAMVGDRDIGLIVGSFTTTGLALCLLFSCKVLLFWVFIKV